MAYAVLEPSGCNVTKNKVRLRLDLYMEPADKHYDKAHNPFHTHFLSFDHTVTDAQIKAEINRTLDYFYSFHEACWDAGLEFIEEWKRVPSRAGDVRCPFVAGREADKSLCDSKIIEIVTRRDDFGVTKTITGGFELPKGHQTIDVGPGATDRTGTDFSNQTLVEKTNPANATGTLDTWELWFSSTSNNATNVEVATFYIVSGNNVSTRDYETYKPQKSNGRT